MTDKIAEDPLELQANPSVWAERPLDEDRLLRLEWLVTNGLGGYAFGTIGGAYTRRYHGLLISALPAPAGRTVMLNHLHEELNFPDRRTALLTGEETPSGLSHHFCDILKSFYLRNGLPIWRYEVDGCVFEKQLWFTHQTNTVRIAYRALRSPQACRLIVRPGFQFRSHEDAVGKPLEAPYQVTIEGERIEVIEPTFPPLRLRFEGCNTRLVLDGGRVRTFYYRVEAARGYDSTGPVWTPGFFEAAIQEGETVVLAASTDDWDQVLAMNADDSLAAEEARRCRLRELCASEDAVINHLALAADQFIVCPQTRKSEVALAHASGEEARTIVAGYPWFTDWGRDTMISLEGLTLTTGRHQEARHILHTFGRHVRDGLIPNLFPEGEKEGLYHTADATLWFFHAVDRYLAWTGDREMVSALLPTFQDIIEHHLQGTRFGIVVDPTDGLLRQGEVGYQLTWMDAKVGDWVVTPRRGKAVEINALWYNALRLLSGWLADNQGFSQSEAIARRADAAYQSFNDRFWNPSLGCLNDVIDGETGDERSIRPNQLFAIALPHAVLHPDRWDAVLRKCVETLLTPMGLRTLAPGQPNYIPRYDGNLRARDAAYHQGTVWAWLIGPLVDAWLKAYPDDFNTVTAFLEGFVAELHEACLGSISEIFDAEAPYTPRGCVAQAWSVAEVLRSWMRVKSCASMLPTATS
jgi:predicted glycogen debranching enzyme